MDPKIISKIIENEQALENNLQILNEQYNLEQYMKTDKDRTDLARSLIIQSNLINGMTIEEAISSVSIAKRTYYTDRWKKFMALARQIINNGIVEEIRAANQNVARKYPEFMLHLMNEAMLESDTGKLVNVGRFLNDSVVGDVMATVGEQGINEILASEEAANRNFNPLDIMFQDNDDDEKIVTIIDND